MEQRSLRKKIRGFFAIPEEIRADFWQETLRKNSLSLWVICIIIFVTETYNVLRVLLWSRSGLGTLNNRIYFGMYCALLAAAALYLLLQRLLRGAAKHLFHNFFLLQNQQACNPAFSGTKKDFSPVSKSCLETI